MMNISNKTFIAIILGSVIIGGFIYEIILQKQLIPQNNNLYVKLKANTLEFKECQASENTIVTKVIDGDTLVVQGGYHVRLLGIDADERNYPCYESAKVGLEQLVLQKKVMLEKDKTDVDQYQRCLRTVFLKDKNINLELVKEGLAIARFYEPDVKYKNQIANAEKQAIDNKIGCKWNR